VTAADFFHDAFVTALAPDEFVTHIVIAAQRGPHAYEKVKICEGSWPIVTAAATTGADGRHHVTLGGVSTTPVRVTDIRGIDDIDERVERCLGEAWADELAPAAYRMVIASGLARRVVSRLLGGDLA
jgi:aerobic carbon-monoxide dehydrogenase medium subunit